MGKRGERLQATVLALLRARRAPLSAYDVLDALKSGNSRLAPTTIYRALDALVASGRVHRLESRNAFVACQCDVDAHAAILSICNHCGAVEETVSKDVMAALSHAVREIGFAPSRHVIEVLGRCSACGLAGELR